MIERRKEDRRKVIRRSIDKPVVMTAAVRRRLAIYVGKPVA